MEIWASRPGLHRDGMMPSCGGPWYPPSRKERGKGGATRHEFSSLNGMGQPPGMNNTQIVANACFPQGDAGPTVTDPGPVDTGSGDVPAVAKPVKHHF